MAVEFSLQAPIPVLRIFDETKAKEFYLDFLDFHLDWDHRFEENFPLYLQISQGPCVIHLSEHHGDACPGSLLRLETEDLDGYRDLLKAKNDKFTKPGVEATSYGLREMKLTDPFGNRLIFFDRKA